MLHGGRAERPAAYLSTVSEPLEKILRFGQTLDFFDQAAIGTSVFCDDLGQTVSHHGLAGVAEQIATLLKERRPGLVVIDSFKALQPFASGPGEFRKFLHELTGMLTATAVTSLWVGEYSSDETAVMPEFAVADAIVNLAVVRAGNRELRLLNVSKVRGSGFLSGQHAYRLTSQGIHVFPRLADSPSQAAYALGDARMPSGIAALDEMIGNGYWPGASTLVAGPSGAGKTVMGLHFIMAGARQGEPGSSRPCRKIRRRCSGWRRASDGRSSVAQSQSASGTCLSGTCLVETLMRFQRLTRPIARTKAPSSVSL